MSKVKPAPLPPDSVIGGYRIVRKVAAGGFGLVYLALDSDGQQVAVKEYLPSSLATRAPGELLPKVQPEKLALYRLGLKSFFEEGRSLAQISHPSVVSVLNFFRENETVYMVMNYLEGAALQAGREVKTFQSNHEGELIDFIQKKTKEAVGIIINPGALTHHSYALHDALLDASLPCVEVHLSDVINREKWRKISVTAPACLAKISGKKERGYLEALALLNKKI